MKFTRLTNCFNSIIILILVSAPAVEGKQISHTPKEEFSALKIKYLNNPIVSVSQKRNILIRLDKNRVPVIHIKDEQQEMILSQNGAEISEGKSYFNPQYQVKKIKAYSLVPEKNDYRKIPVTKFTKSVEFDDQYYFDDTFSYTYNFPATGQGVKRCSLIETEISDPYLPQTFFFARSIPVEYSELTITMPIDVKIKYHLFGLDTTTVSASQKIRGKTITYRWSSTQPKVLDRDFLAPGIRYIRPHLVVNIASVTGKSDTTRYMGTLSDLYRWKNRKESRVNSVIKPEIVQMTDSVAGSITDVTEKVKAIYKWVQNNIKYIAIEDGENGLVPREADLVLKRRYGDCKDKSSLLTAMIRSIGEKASLASVGTRELPYKYSDFPSVNCSNHMVAVWWKDKKPVILDGTSLHNRLEDIPAFIQGKECVIGTEGDNYLLYKIPIAEANMNVQYDSISMVIDRDIVSGNGFTDITGEFKSIVAGQIDGKSIDKQLAFWPGVISSASEKMQVKKLAVSDLSEVNTSIKANYDFQLSDYVVMQNDRIYLNMNLERELKQLEVKCDRTLPVEVEFKKQHHIIYNLAIPRNMHVEYLPPPQIFENPKFGYSQVYAATDREVILKTEIYINTLLIEGEDFTLFRDMLESLKKSYRQTIALTAK